MKRDSSLIKNEEQRIHIGNAILIAQHLLNTDIANLVTQHDKKFAMEIRHLRELLHRYRYASAQAQPRGTSTIEWVEQLAKDLMQQTEHCVQQLSDEAKDALWETLHVYN